jgi:PAS domain S-box-containing protein
MDGEIVFWSEGSVDLFGYSANEAVGQYARELLRTDFLEPIDAIESAFNASGEWQGRLRHVSSSGRWVWTETVMRTHHSAERGEPIILEQNTDITARVELEERSAILARELEHRVKNVLAVVQGLARVTFPDAPAEQRRKMEDRIAALAEANNVLHQGSWREANLSEILLQVATQLAVEDRLHLGGPEVNVPSEHALNLALTLHELCTNALKYGALSVPGGHVELSWTLEGSSPRKLYIQWSERRGPRVQPPSKTGFGTRLITHSFARTAGSADLSFKPTGVTCRISIVLG